VLVDVVAGGLFEEGKAEGLAEPREVLDGVVDDVGEKGKQDRQRQDLDDDGASFLVAPQPQQGVGIARRNGGARLVRQKRLPFNSRSDAPTPEFSPEIRRGPAKLDGGPAESRLPPALVPSMSNARSFTGTAARTAARR
jgi:hypothetical protein